jgi:hypothetical protein
MRLGNQPVDHRPVLQERGPLEGRFALGYAIAGSIVVSQDRQAGGEGITGEKVERVGAAATAEKPMHPRISEDHFRVRDSIPLTRMETR